MPEQPHEERLAATFVELADTMVSDFDVIHFLHVLADRCVELLDIAAAGVTLAAPQGHPPLEAAASDERTRQLELAGIEWDEGPCRDCQRAGIFIPDVLFEHPQARTRWPRFAAEARRLGFTSVVAAPLRLRDQVIGALNLFRDQPGPLAPGQLRLGQALADIATIGILQQRAAREQATLTAQLQGALQSRTIIEQAKGALAHRRQVSVDEAFGLLRTYARHRKRLLTEVAKEVIDGTADPGLLYPHR